MRIKYSKRGLTFSFKENETFKAGTKYRYVLDTKTNEVILLPDEDGKYKLSQKGKNKKPLVDLRNKEIKDAIALAQYLEIEVLDDKIIVHVIKKNINKENLSDRELIDMLDKSENITFEISKEELIAHDNALVEMLEASGLFSAAVQSDLAYVYDVGSFFSGAGPLDYPFHMDDSFNIVSALDFDEDACKTYRHNIGDHIICADIREIVPEALPDMDVIIAGSCCQGFSNANRKGNKELDNSKCELVDEFCRMVIAKRPLCFMLENVPQLLTKEQGRFLESILQSLSDYNITYSLVTDSELGGYSLRKRVILFGCLKEMGKIVIPNVELSRIKPVKEALAKVDDTWYNYTDITKPKPETERKMAYVRPGHNYKDIPEMAHLDRHSDVYRRLDENKPSVTIVNWRKVNLMPPVGNRILSVAEAAAIMGLEKGYEILGNLSSRQNQIGNCVPQSIANFGKEIIKNALYRYTNQCFLTV